MATITTADVRAYVAQRLAAKASSAEINRELSALKRMYSLSCQAGKLHARPHIPMLQERNVRTGFFELDQFVAVRRHISGHTDTRSRQRRDERKRVSVWGIGAGGGNRTLTGGKPHRILSPARLPVSPLRPPNETIIV